MPGWALAIGMRFGVLFLMLGAALAALAREAGGRAYGLLWPAISFLVVGTSYLVRRPRMLGKRDDGTLAMAAFVPLGRAPADAETG